jgi:salicylate hydroxylase
MAVVLRGAEADDIPARLESYEGLRRERTSAVQRGARDNGRRYDSDYEDLAQRDREIQRSRDYRLWLYDYDAEAVALEANVAID